MLEKVIYKYKTKRCRKGVIYTKQVKMFMLVSSIFFFIQLIPTAGVGVSTHCGFHALHHFAFTRCNVTHCTNYYQVKYGICLDYRNLDYEVEGIVHGRRLYYTRTYENDRKRDIEVGNGDQQKMDVKGMLKANRNAKSLQIEVPDTTMQISHRSFSPKALNRLKIGDE
ncbi:uncharacterized protein LOC125673457 isoform X2 [Ostrea edulis]|uniref:uncharacterized protein LOC125673457 isoform X2 n=1 Tax=Ostrea edulis TaxID=37623 RepID=UPI0024AEB60C|nr:uncharacterized protein LOC125673457 isoform X2 [Ostrea edulis]